MSSHSFGIYLIPIAFLYLKIWFSGINDNYKERDVQSFDFLIGYGSGVGIVTLGKGKLL